MQTSTYPLRLPASLKAAVEQASNEDGTSINQFVVTAVAAKLSALKSVDFLTERAREADVEAAKRIVRRKGGQLPQPNEVLA
jgi:uncharacterized protein (DUF1778 family)